ncbi:MULTISPECIES: flagellar hook-basal body complex protein FliE [Vibrio]|uniref:Flagellar hook-basal body complex protein FliE n=2 Tax=Vibrio genomosp. F10 TaxID=723171 RepID=A0A1B9QWP8_9VIBR|nr:MULTISPECIES: flagellar hook-basal body complex protein FliE [Vibrio]OCH74113.1 flagellar hook-basal body complex protein FliE [Vibrio genomosp. F10]OEE35408.1 flagellar hook-basal body complex protein FliE [Vibrio genomosp. F10 str. ZF-129]OEE94458.1 flagellar hook-basal body complex protein FliE [Vibrio genomosp. F10 str. 9ZC157]OEE97710.1 flagellar hook-basal body complex protein FliE [Vibrio genomosp. F10 str. 9ZD137]OEF04688.1 flagellar hook-basal body complex protein FliE [Vibrio geno
MIVNGLQGEMQALMFEATNTKPTATGQSVGADFGNMLNKAINNVNGLSKSSSDFQMRFDRGDEDVSLSDVMIARNKSSVAFEATIQVRNKLVEAYKELMNMPV